MTHTCLAKFEKPDAARAAVQRLIDEGLDPSSMDVMTSQPIHGEGFLRETKPTQLHLWALGGGALGFLAGGSLSTITALNYPLVKGGMPLVSPWTAGLITYETTMLGVVVATLVGLLAELRLPKLDRPYDPSVVDGGVVLAVACAESGCALVEDTVNATGATKVSWVPTQQLPTAQSPRN